MEIGSRIVDGRYTIERKLGQGAFGAVYLANDNVSDTAVAIKMVPTEVSKEVDELTDLKRNFQLVHGLSHSHIAAMRTLDHDKTLDKYCLIMEYVEGNNLKAYRKKQPDRKIPVVDAIRICRQLAEAIDYAHYKGILHRDVKPENVIIDANRDVYLLDFGLASQIRSTVMKRSETIDANAMAGTRPYMAPEQFKGKPVVQASDIWALGVVFCEMITGDLPFYSDDFQVLKASVCEETVDPIAELDKTQNQIVQKVLAKNPKARFAKAVDFAKALENSIKPKGSKNQWVVLGGLSVVLILGGLLLNMYWQEKAKLEQESSLTGIERITRDLFRQMLGNKAAYFRAGLGILGSFPGCNEEVYASAYTALINSANRNEWKLLVRKDLQAVLDDEKVVSGYRQERAATALSEVEKSQAVIVGNCINDKLYVRVIDTNSHGLAAAMGPYRYDSADQKRAINASLAKEKRPTYDNSYSSNTGSHSVGDTWTDPVTGMEFVWVPKGCFQMGSPASEANRDSDEKQHEVCLSNGYWLGKYEVTQGEWEKVMGNNPSHFKSCGDRCPVEKVSWDDVQRFIGKLDSKSGKRFRLPTEAEWEYAARARTTTPFSFGKTIGTDQVNYDGNYPYGNGRKGEYREKTMTVGSLPGNAWGLHEMHGNVWEWVQDWYGDYPSNAVTDPTGARSGSLRVFRGGSWVIYAQFCRSANRYRNEPGFRRSDLGFRLARPL